VRLSLKKHILLIFRGVKGFVKDENFNPIEGASMKVRGRDVGFQTTKVRFLMKEFVIWIITQILKLQAIFTVVQRFNFGIM